MKKKCFIMCVVVILICTLLIYLNIKNKHTFTLGNGETLIKAEEIQPLFGRVKVNGNSDTDVVFTDVITGEEYLVGYITSGVVESIKLEKGHWYTVKGKGILTISPVNVRIE